MSQLQDPKWLLLLHQIPPSPPYFRAKVLRRLGQLGALTIKNSAYLLPDTPEHLEDFQWVRSEITDGGGGAWIFSVTSSSLSNAEIEDQFRQLRSEDYKQLLDSLNTNPGDWQKLKRKFQDIRAIDFFGAPGREEVESAMQSIEQQQGRSKPAKTLNPDLKDINGHVWVTRKDVHIDRIASAWLIRRFIDPTASFVLVDQSKYTPTTGQIRFDMFDGEFTHEGDRCTFEVLLTRWTRSDAALEAIAQMVHDLDIKDEKYQRPETSGFAAMISGIIALYSTDEQRIEEGARLIDATYAALTASKL